MAHFKNVPFVSVAGQGHVVSKIRALKIKWYIARRGASNHIFYLIQEECTCMQN